MTFWADKHYLKNEEKWRTVNSLKNEHLHLV
jgi:hypothetical protein